MNDEEIINNCENDCMEYINNIHDQFSLLVRDLVADLNNKYSINAIYTSLYNLRCNGYINGGVDISEDVMGNKIPILTPIILNN